MSVYSSIAIVTANLLFGALTLTAASQQSVSVPLPPLAPRSTNECSAYEKEVQRVRDIVDKWHTQCLDSFKGQPSHPASNGCSYEACAKYHHADQLGESNVQLCFDKVERFKKEERENERREEEARRLQEEARQKAEQERREAEAERIRQEQQRYQQTLAEAQQRRDQIERARQDAVRRQQQFEQELRRKQQEENTRKIQETLIKLSGEFGEFQKIPAVTDASIKDALGKAGFDEMGRCVSAACLAAMSSIPQNMTADEFAVWAEETRHHGWDDPVSVAICPSCAGDFKADGFGFEDHTSLSARIVEDDAKPAQMRRAPNPAQNVEPRSNYFPPLTLRDPDKYKNLSPSMADASNLTASIGSLSTAAQQWIQDFGDGFHLREELIQRANAELKMLPPGTGAIIRAYSDSKGVWSSYVAATGRTYEEAIHNYTAAPGIRASGARERLIWVKRVP